MKLRMRRLRIIMKMMIFIICEEDEGKIYFLCKKLKR